MEGSSLGEGQPRPPSPRSGSASATLSHSPTQEHRSHTPPPARYTSPLPHRPGPHSKVDASSEAPAYTPPPPRYSHDPTPRDLAPRRRSAPRDPLSAPTQPSQPRLAAFQKAPCPHPGPLQAHPHPQRPEAPPAAPRPRPATHGPVPTGTRAPGHRPARDAPATPAHSRPPRPPTRPPGSAQPSAPRGGRDSAARASRVPSCVGRARAGRGRAGRDRCARGLPWPGTLHAPASARPRPGAPGADLEPKRSRSVA